MGVHAADVIESCVEITAIVVREGRGQEEVGSGVRWRFAFHYHPCFLY